MLGKLQLNQVLNLMWESERHFSDNIMSIGYDVVFF